MVVYHASAKNLPTSKWDSDNPVVCLVKISREEEPVRNHFSLNHVYRCPSFEGCGCGFQCGQDPDDGTTPEKLSKGKQSRRELADILLTALEMQDFVELYACWDGEQAEKPRFHEHAKPLDFTQTRIGFREREFITVSLRDTKRRHSRAHR